MRPLIVAACCGLALATSALAQPRLLAAWGQREELYNPNAPVLLRGTILQVDLSGPYASLSIMHEERAGQPQQQWAVDLGETRTLAARKIDRAVLQPGAAVVVRAFQAKDGSKLAGAEAVRKQDNRRIHMSSRREHRPER